MTRHYPPAPLDGGSPHSQSEYIPRGDSDPYSVPRPTYPQRSSPSRPPFFLQPPRTFFDKARLYIRLFFIVAGLIVIAFGIASGNRSDAPSGWDFTPTVAGLPPPTAGRAAPPKGVPSPGPWWTGQWVTDTGADTPRMALDARAHGVLVVDSPTAGYELVVPVVIDQRTDRRIVFTAQPDARTIETYLLEPDTPGQSCKLYRLASPPAKPPKGGLVIPRAPDQFHQLVSRLVRRVPSSPAKESGHAP